MYFITTIFTNWTGREKEGSSSSVFNFLNAPGSSRVELHESVNLFPNSDFNINLLLLFSSGLLSMSCNYTSISSLTALNY